MAAADHALRSSGGGTESDASRYYDFVALLVTVVVSCGVFGWCMRASRTLIRYHAGLSKMFSDSREFYDSCKPDDADTDMDSDEQDHEQKHAAGLCKSDALVAAVVMCHTGLLNAMMVMALFSWRRIGMTISVAIVRCHIELSYGVSGWCMRALRILIGYHTSLLSSMTVMALFSWKRVGMAISGVAIFAGLLSAMTVMALFSWHARVALMHLQTAMAWMS